VKFILSNVHLYSSQRQNEYKHEVQGKQTRNSNLGSANSDITANFIREALDE